MIWFDIIPIIITTLALIALIKGGVMIYRTYKNYPRKIIIEIEIKKSEDKDLTFFKEKEKNETDTNDLLSEKK